MSNPEADLRHHASEKDEEVLSRLVAEQGATPIDDVDELAALWPADDDPDAVMNFVLSERKARP